LHAEVISQFLAMRQAAALEGIDLQVASGFRSYERQLTLWNSKANGQRTLLNDRGEAVDATCLDDNALMFAILRWSAIPGCSRHHWGTDMDVWDAAAVAADYPLQLVPSEYTESGPFAALNTWLELHAEEFGFIRPYAVDKGGIAPEPWHLSYFPLSSQFDREMDITLVRKILDNKQLVLRECLLHHLDDIFSKYLCT
jgi:LAS superfamily LD-carboxypeptidase LdcB